MAIRNSDPTGRARWSERKLLVLHNGFAVGRAWMTRYHSRADLRGRERRRAAVPHRALGGRETGKPGFDALRLRENYTADPSSSGTDFGGPSRP